MKIPTAPRFVMSAVSLCLALARQQYLLLPSLHRRLRLPPSVARSALHVDHSIQQVNRSVQTAALCSGQRLLQA